MTHRVRRVEADRNHGVPVTNPARTLDDCATLLTPQQLRRAVNQAQVGRLTQPELLLAQPRLRALVGAHGATRSRLEDLLLELDLPEPPRVNAVVHGIEVDFHLPRLRLVIEADGYAFHRTRIAFEDDHEKRLHLEAQGERVVAVTYAQVKRPRETAQRLRAIAAQQAAVLRNPSSRRVSQHAAT